LEFNPEYGEGWMEAESGLSGFIRLLQSSPKPVSWKELDPRICVVFTETIIMPFPNLPMTDR
jgi:hypothetical protein